jgi:hypothetical protein
LINPDSHDGEAVMSAKKTETLPRCPRHDPLGQVRVSIAKLTEFVTHADRTGFEAYVDQASVPTGFSIFWEFEQGSAMRLAGIAVESKFYLIGNAVIARDLFRYTAAAGLGSGPAS